MPDKKYSIGEAIKTSIDLEKNGRKFYLEAATTTKSESGKKIFQMLADEENLHLATFKKMLKSLDNLDNWQDIIKDYPQARQVPVFGVKQPAKDATKVTTDELNALRLAMKQEKEAISFFEKSSELAENEDVKKIFSFVREQEVFHYNLLQAEYDHLNQTGFWFDKAEFRMDGKF